jgi:hypothetical protein
MSSHETTNSNAERSWQSVLRDKWLNPRRKRFWLLVTLLTYTLAGFYLAPLLVRKNITDTVNNDLGREVRIEHVKFNPFSFSLEIHGLELDDVDGKRLASFDEFLVDFELSSLFRWAWTFREIRLSQPYFFFERFKTDDSRLSRLLSDASAQEGVDTPTGEEDGLPRLLIGSIVIQGGSGDLVDNVPPTPVQTRLGPIDVTVRELNTLPDRHGQQSVTIALEHGASLSWQGSLSLSPLDSEGQLVLNGSRLDQSIAYLKALLPLSSISATLSARFDYRIQMDAGGVPEIEIDDMDIELSDLAVTGLEPTTDFLGIAKSSLSGGRLRYPEQTLEFSQLRIEQPRLVSWLDESGGLSLGQLTSFSNAEPQTAQDASESAITDWAFGIDEVIFEQGAADFTDRGVQPPAAIGLQNLQLGIEGLNNTAGASFPLNLSGELTQGGSFEVEGQFSWLPDLNLEADVTTRGIPLALGQPYAQRFASVSISGGALDADLELSLQGTEQLALGGAISIPGMDLLDTREDKPLLGWSSLNIDRFDLDTTARSLHLSRVMFQEPFGRLVINADKTTNLSELMTAENIDVSPESTGENSFDVIVGGIAIEQGEMDFSDLSLPLPFSTRIADLGGTISTISTASTQPSNIRLEGKVDEFGLARIEGKMNLLDPIQQTRMTVEFRNLFMSNLSPYTVEFAGREIAEGKLNLDLGYFIEDGQLQGENAVVMSDLVLGDKVDHPDAASLPLGLAVALLTDADGVIDINLPVEGDVNDPEFKIGGVVWQAITGLITKVVSAPFRLLGGLIGIDSEDLGQFQFLAGRFDLTPPELEKITQLEEALTKRPELAMEISGATDPAVDVPALQYLRLRSIVIERLGGVDTNEDDEGLMLDVEVRGILEELYVERFPESPLESLRAEYMAPAANDPEGAAELDQLAYAAGLGERLIQSEVISPQDIDALASARAEAIRSAFMANGIIDENRLIVIESGTVESEDGEWVVMELGVAAED